MTRQLLLIITILASSFVVAQPTLDTIKNCMKQKPHLFAKIDTRNSFIENSRAKIFGIKGGISYGKRLFFGIGYNQLFRPSNAFNKEVYFLNDKQYKDSTVATLGLYYISISAEYIFYNAGKWQLSMPLQFGIGKTYYKYSVFGKKHLMDENLNMIYEPGVSVEYKFTKWLGVGADIGYRFVITNDRKFNQNFNSPTYAFKLLIYYNELFKTLFPHSSIADKI